MPFLHNAIMMFLVQETAILKSSLSDVYLCRVVGDVNVCVCVYVYTYICIYVYVDTHIHIYIYIYTCRSAELGYM